MKTLYEKFCYLKGLLERKLDDPENLKFLKKRGFKIEIRSDALSQCYIYVTLKKTPIPLIQAYTHNSLLLFIENCCNRS